MKNRITLLAALILISCAFAFSADMVVNNGYDPGAMRTDGTNADSPVFPGSATVNGAFVASDTATIGTSTAAAGYDLTVASGAWIGGQTTLSNARATRLGVSSSVGIATTTPRTLLDVYSLTNAAVFGGATGAVWLQGGTIQGGILGYNGASFCPLDIRATSGIGTGIYINTNRAVSVATTNAQPGYDLTVASGAWFGGDVSADQFTDRSDAPESLAEAYAIVQSHEVKDGKVDHRKLHAAAWGRKFRLVATGKNVVKWRDVEQENSKGEKISVPESYEEPEILTVSEPDQQGRNLSKVISAQSMVIKSLLSRIEALEAK